MAKINIRGIGTVTRTRDIADDLLAFKNDPQYLPNDKYVLHGFDIEKRDIGPIDLEDFETDDKDLSLTRKHEDDDRDRQMQKDYEDNIRKRCNRRPDDKAKDVKIYETIYSLFGVPTQEFREEVAKRQAEYFRANPRHPYAVVSIKDLLPKMEGEQEGHIANIVPSRMIERLYDTMHAGIYTARRTGNI